ncbi:MAG TPA: prolipoprotein diacylglyceryl transferase [Candidatus Binataceae bacterium]|nr:prolipoprotein diacylglyceryl transferase [Candidatus Binataceae bacterium]
MYPILLHLGPITIYSYGLMMALGFLAADEVIRRECHRQNIDPGYSSSLVIVAAIAGLAGSRIYAILDDLPTYLADPKAMIFSGSGFVWYGGLFGGILGAYVVSRWYKIPFAITADLAAPALAIGQALGRVGCLVSGDGDWGLPSTLPWAMSFPNAIVGWNSQTVLKLDSHYRLVSGFFPGVRVQPTPIYEAILYTIAFAILWSMRKTSYPAGRLLYWYFVLVGGSRFLVEFVRVNPRVLLGLSEAQLIASAMVIGGTIALVLTAGQKKPEDAATAGTIGSRAKSRDEQPAVASRTATGTERA